MEWRADFREFQQHFREFEQLNVAGVCLFFLKNSEKSALKPFDVVNIVAS